MKRPRALLAVVVLCSIPGCSSPPQGDDPRAETVVAAREGLSAEVVGLAKWSSVVPLPLVPVSVANLPDGKVLLWSSDDRFSFGPEKGQTYTATYDPTLGTVSERLVSETSHDMFCPGTANLADGRILVNGGLSSGTTSIFDPSTGTWTRAADMNIPRAYEGTTPLADGSVFTLGGSWAGGVGNKHGELWTEAQGWRRLSGVRIDPFLSTDATRDFGMDSHLWLIPSGNGRVLHAGPGFDMHWIDTAGEGEVTSIGRRGDDQFSVNGNAVLYDIGKVLKVGGAAGYDGIASNANAYVLEYGATVNVRKIQPLVYQRAFHNSVVLPNGQVLIVGGATVAVGFSDSNSILAPELFDPATETFTALPPMSVPRNYHSVALLLADGRVLSAGGGLCGANCAANHPDLQVLSPPYLFNSDGTPATRPVITSAPASATHGTTISVTTDAPVASFALLRSSSTTHALNNDQRRIPLVSHATTGHAYDVEIPSNPGWAVPGLYMLFALNEQGVPSVAATVRVGAAEPLRLAPVRDQSSTVGADALLTLKGTSPTAAPLRYSVSGLPSGLVLDPTAGAIVGTLTQSGSSLVTASVTDGVQTTSTQFAWTVAEAGTTRFVLLQADSEINGNPWSSAAEVTLLDDNGKPLSAGAFTATADSAELAGQNGSPTNAIDGNPQTIWHTQWQAASPPPPHWLKIDLGGSFRLSGLRYLPRQDGSPNGTIGQYRVSLSGDGTTFGSPVASGNFQDLGPLADEKTVYFDDVALGKAASQSSTTLGASAGRAVDGNRDGVLANGSVSQTNSEALPFWEVDLGALHDLFAVRLWNRSDCCADALANFAVFASDAPMTTRSLDDLLADVKIAHVQVAGVAPATALVNLPARARYVRIELTATGSLQLAEVEVFGRKSANRGPSLAQPAPAALVVGSLASLALSASDLDGDALTYAATGLPTGLTLDTATGVISGTTTAAGTFNVDASVSDGLGGSASVHFSWFVGLSLPVIQPLAAPIAQTGTSVSYTASATGSAGLTYQWSFGDGTPDSAQSASPTVSHTYAGPGVYTVTLTVRNSDGTASSLQVVQAISGAPVVGAAPRASSDLALEPRQGGARLWSVNIDNDSVSVFDAGTGSKLAEVAVGKDPRCVAVAQDGKIWVTNKGASTISVIDPSSLQVVQTVPLASGSQPFGLVARNDGGMFVVLEGKGQLVKIDASFATAASLDVGPHPRHLALVPAGDLLLISRFITSPQPGEGTATVLSAIQGVPQGGEVLVVQAATLSLVRAVVLRHSDKPDTTVSGRGVPNYLGAPAISPDGLSAWIPSKQDNIARGRLRDQHDLDFQNTVRAISSRIALGTQAEDYPARVDHDNSGLATAAAYHPSGVYVFVALETSRQLAVLDAAGKRELFRVDAGRSPQGLIVSADGHTLYVHNALDRSVGIYDVRPLERGESRLPLLTSLTSVTTEKLAPAVLRGKQLFYDARDPRLAHDSYLSCATCHDDGGHDGRTWDLTGLGEGLRNTVSLRGRHGSQGLLHWSGNFDEVQDFEGQIRVLSLGTGLMSDADFNAGTRRTPLGDPKAGLSDDLDALAAYLGSLDTFAPSPFRAAGALTASAQAGRAVFANNCAACHGGADYTDSDGRVPHDVGTLKPSSGSRLFGVLLGIDTPTLRDVWDTAPYLHDGSALTLAAAVQAHTGVVLSAGDRTDVVSFLQQIGAEEPATSRPNGSGLVGQYFANNALSGVATVTRGEAVHFDWAAGSPAAGLPVDNFSARWTGRVSIPSTGTYVFQTISDDGVRLWTNGAEVINNWTDHGPTPNNSSAQALVAGQLLDLRLEYYEKGGGATVSLNWQLPGSTSFVPIPQALLQPSGTGLLGQYFSNNALTGTPSLSRYEAVNFDWKTGSPGSGLPSDNFSVRWTGHLLAPSTGNYVLQTVSDDGVRLWVDGKVAIGNWTDHGPTPNSSPAIALVAGQLYEIKMEYYEKGGGAVAKLNWLTPDGSAQTAIPQTYLYGN